MSLTYLSLFSGIGALDLGLDRAGWTCAGQVEIDPYCRAVLERHWPEVPRHDDVRTASAWWLDRGGVAVDMVAGGFPCQPFSSAGRRLGVGDDRFGWPWMFDVIRVARPRYVLVENVAAILDDGDAFGWVLRDLASLRFDARWGVLSACAVGAPHTRERLFLVAYPNGLNGQKGLGVGSQTALPGGDLPASAWPDPIDRFMEAASRGARVADGSPEWLEPARVRAIGNAVVPQVTEHIGRLIQGHAMASAR